MAKKGKSMKVRLKCTVCNSINYTTKRRIGGQAELKLKLKKYCPVCKKHTEHTEVKIK